MIDNKIDIRNLEECLIELDKISKNLKDANVPKLSELDEVPYGSILQCNYHLNEAIFELLTIVVFLKNKK